MPADDASHFYSKLYTIKYTGQNQQIHQNITDLKTDCSSSLIPEVEPTTLANGCDSDVTSRVVRIKMFNGIDTRIMFCTFTTRDKQRFRRN